MIRFVLRLQFLAILSVLINYGSVNADDSLASTATDKTTSESTPSPDTPKQPETKPDEVTNQDDEEKIASALPVSSDPVQVFGWREWITLNDGKHPLKLKAKLDSGALTSSIHATEKKMFERDGRKWMRFVVFDPKNKNSKRLRIEAPLVRLARIKNPNSESEVREVVNLTFQIGDRKLTSEFTLNNRSNMLNPVLIGRRCLSELGWVDPSRTFLAEKNLMR